LQLRQFGLASTLNFAKVFCHASSRSSLVSFWVPISVFIASVACIEAIIAVAEASTPTVSHVS
jgi:hypothetical protein